MLDFDHLYLAALNGDRKAEDELFRNLKESFGLFARQRIWNQDYAEEVVQEALTAVFNKYKEVEIEKSFSAWAYKVMEFKFRDYIKSKDYLKNQPKCLIDEDSAHLSYNFDPALKRKLLECFKELFKKNNRFARVLNLKYQGYNAGEICTKVKITKNILYILVSRARSILNECLQRHK